MNLMNYKYCFISAIVLLCVSVLPVALMPMAMAEGALYDSMCEYREELVNTGKVNVRNAIDDLDRIDDGFQSYLPYVAGGYDSKYVIKALYDLLPKYETLYLQSHPGKDLYEFILTEKGMIRLITMKRKSESELDDLHKDPFNEFPLSDFYHVVEYQVHVPERVTDGINKAMLVFKGNKIPGECLTEARLSHLYELMNFDSEDTCFYGSCSKIFGFSFSAYFITKNTSLSHISALYDVIYQNMYAGAISDTNRFVDEIDMKLSACAGMK